MTDTRLSHDPAALGTHGATPARETSCPQTLSRAEAVW